MIQARLNRFNPDNNRVSVSVRTESAVTEEVVFGTNRTNIQGGIELEQLRGIVRPLVDTQPHLFRPGTDNFNRPMFVRIVDRPILTAADASDLSEQAVVPILLDSEDVEFTTIRRTLSGFIRDFRTQEFRGGALEHFRQDATLVNAPVTNMQDLLLPIRHFFGLFPAGAMMYMLTYVLPNVALMDGEAFIRGFHTLLYIFRPFLLTVVNIRVWARHTFFDMREGFRNQLRATHLDIQRNRPFQVILRPDEYFLNQVRDITQGALERVNRNIRGIRTMEIPQWLQYAAITTIATGILGLFGPSILNPQTALGIARALYNAYNTLFPLFGFTGRLYDLFVQAVRILIGAGGGVAVTTTAPAIRSFFERFDEILVVIVEY